MSHHIPCCWKLKSSLFSPLQCPSFTGQGQSQLYWTFSSPSHITSYQQFPPDPLIKCFSKRLTKPFLRSVFRPEMGSFWEMAEERAFKGHGSEGDAGGESGVEVWGFLAWIQVEGACTGLFTEITARGNGHEMKHLVFKSVLGTRRNTAPLITQRHIINTRVSHNDSPPRLCPGTRTCLGRITGGARAF